MKKLVWALSGSVLLAGCVYVTTLDYLSAAGTVLGSDGRTPVQNLRVSDYNWIVTYRDGSTVSNPVRVDRTTDAEGRFRFDSQELNLRSGQGLTSCNDVCVSWSTGFENYCVVYDTYCEDYCAAWSRDSFGNEVCLDWRTSCTDTCAQYATNTYQYCDTFARDCNVTYPPRTASDIAQAYSEIRFALGSSVITSQSLNSTLASQAFQTVTTRDTQGNSTVIETWNQNDTYVTPITGSLGSNGQPLLASLTPAQQRIVDARNAGKRRPPVRAEGAQLGRIRPASRVIEHLEQLSPEQTAALEKARTASRGH